MNSYISLVFDREDFLEAQKTFINYFGTDNPTGETPDGVLFDGSAPTLWLNLATVTIPTLASLIAIWLGKGKQIIIEREKNNVKQKITLKNYDKRSTTKILKKFLND